MRISRSVQFPVDALSATKRMLFSRLDKSERMAGIAMEGSLINDTESNETPFDRVISIVLSKTTRFWIFRIFEVQSLGCCL